MTRKLRNSLNALAMTSALCATAAFAVAAMPFNAPSDGPAVVPAVRAEAGHRKSPNRIRHALAMPYFSFLPRG